MLKRKGLRSLIRGSITCRTPLSVHQKRNLVIFKLVYAGFQILRSMWALQKSFLNRPRYTSLNEDESKSNMDLRSFFSLLPATCQTPLSFYQSL